MAKSSGKPPRTARETEGPEGPDARQVDGTSSAADDTLVDLAEDLGKLLGTAQNRMTNWLGQRQEIATQLVKIRDTANEYLRELTAGGASLAAAIERGRKASVPTRPAEPVSEEAAPQAAGRKGAATRANGGRRSKS